MVTMVSRLCYNAHYKVPMHLTAFILGIQRCYSTVATVIPDYIDL